MGDQITHLSTGTFDETLGSTAEAVLDFNSPFNALLKPSFDYGCTNFPRVR